MANYNQKFNSDDSAIRHIIIGFLADLNTKLYFYRQISSVERIYVDVPFYYSITGDDQFLRDNFLFSTASGPNCHPNISFADANYDVVPRGIVNLTGLSIDSGKLVNKRTTGNYNKMNSEGIVEAYVSEFDMIPITMTFDIEILVSSILDSFKITEAIIKRMYKSNYFNVEVGHLEEGNYKIASYYALPEDYTMERPIGFTYEEKEKYKINMQVEVNSFLPSFNWGDEESFSPVSSSEGIDAANGIDRRVRIFGANRRNGEFFAGNRMYTIESNVGLIPKEDELHVIQVTEDIEPADSIDNNITTRIIDETDIDNR